MALHQFAEGDAAQEIVDLLTEVEPQFVSEAGLTILAIAVAIAAGGIEAFIYSIEHRHYRDFTRLAAETITAAGAAHAHYQTLPAQTREQLFEIRKRYALPLRNIGQRDRLLAGVHHKIQHRSNRVTPFRRKFH